MQSLRTSFNQLVVNHQVQTPAANRNFSAAKRSAGRKNRSGLVPSPIAPLNPWTLHAVRADQATEVSDTSVIQQIADLTRKVDDLHTAAIQRSNAALEAGFTPPHQRAQTEGGGVCDGPAARAAGA